MNKQLMCWMIGIVAMAGGCESWSRQSPTDKIVPIAPENFVRQWSADLPLERSSVEALHVRNEAIFIYSTGHMAYVLDRASGTLLHIDPVTSGRTQLLPPVVLEDEIVYPTNAVLEVYDKSGKKLRSIDLESSIRSPAVGSGKNIYIGIDYENGGRIRKIDIERTLSTTPRWELMTFGGLSAAPALHQGILYVGSEDGRVYAVGEDRSSVWPLPRGVFETGGRIVADIKADDSGVYVASTDSKLYCLDRNTGKIKWQFFSGALLTRGPEVTETTVYQYVPGHGLAAIDKTSGQYNREPKWISREARKLLSEDEQYAYVLGRNNQIVALDKQTGKAAFRSQRRDLAVFGTNTRNGIIYAATRDGEVLAIRPVLKPGDVGQMVMILQPLSPLAKAD